MMRLFYALWPDDAVRAGLQRLQTFTRGRHTRYGNLHITLAFLGERPEQELPILKSVLADLPRGAIDLSIDRMGYFRRNRIAWAGTHAVPDALLHLHGSLGQALAGQGIALEASGKFKPHVTLARDADAPPEADFEPFAWHASRVALMHSTHDKGELTYRVLAARDLAAPF